MPLAISSIVVCTRVVNLIVATSVKTIGIKVCDSSCSPIATNDVVYD